MHGRVYLLITPRAYAQVRLSNWYCQSVVVVVVVCHKKIRKNFITHNLEAITTSKQEATIQIPQKSTCAYLTVTKALLVSACPALNIDMVCHFTTVTDSNTTEYDRGQAFAVS